MKILQIIPAKKSDRCGCEPVRCFVLAENQAGRSMIIPCQELGLLDLTDIVDAASSLLSSAGFAASQKMLLDWAEES